MVSLACLGAVCDTGQGNGRPKSVVTAWKTVTKLFPRVIASWGVEFEGTWGLSEYREIYITSHSNTCD